MDMLDTLETLDISRLCSKVMQDNLREIPPLIEQQLDKGLRSDGSEILPAYTQTTIQIKELKGQPTDRVTLHDEGNYYRGLYADMQGDQGFITGSKDVKSDKLDKKYATAKGRLTAMNETSKEELADNYLEPEFQREVETQTGLKFS